MKIWTLILVILTGIALPALGFVGAGFVGKRYWTQLVRERYEAGRRRGYEELDEILWREVLVMRAAARTHRVEYRNPEFIEGWEAASAYVGHLSMDLEEESRGARTAPVHAKH